ncbi:hypothetical protein [Halalkalibacter sp. APA_J-10(15)]|uniref:hypothetical protein n=1 Tax=Halalkalibacter sp. APA_J-10(15) TaxID=2933805 RepID=UPI001FF3CDA2|nr:hypothetical protein [Halalkalibacter sp. APA_J-10(15)]MCK0469971.1 hypothetical protein [Halalkalibacter sp. APA_J-10(15)]
MHPTIWIEFIIVGLIIGIIIIVSRFLKKKRLKMGLLLITIILCLYTLFFFARPYWIDSQVNKQIVFLENYLIEQHPQQKWTITTVPHREEGYKHLNPYYIRVTFEDEPEVTYYYLVKNEDTVKQVGWFSTKE